MAFTTLKQLVKNMFPALQPASNDLSIKYRDDEDDVISITTDFELEEALRQAPGSPPVLRLQVEALSSQPIQASGTL